MSAPTLAAATHGGDEAAVVAGEDADGAAVVRRPVDAAHGRCPSAAAPQLGGRDRAAVVDDRGGIG